MRHYVSWKFYCNNMSDHCMALTTKIIMIVLFLLANKSCCKFMWEISCENMLNFFFCDFLQIFETQKFFFISISSFLSHEFKDQYKSICIRVIHIDRIGFKSLNFLYFYFMAKYIQMNKVFVLFYFIFYFFRKSIQA